MEKEKEAKRRRGIISTALSFKYGFLVFTIWLLIWNVTSLLKWQNYGYDEYGNLIIALMLLFNHIAFCITEKGWLSLVMKTIAWVWIAFVWAYLFWIDAV